MRVGGLFQLFWGRGGDFQDLGHHPNLSFDSALELSWHLWVRHLVDNWGSRSNQDQLVCHLQFSSVQFNRSVVSDPLQPHGLQHAQLPCPSPTPGAHSNSCPLSQWSYPTISSSVVPFSSCLQSSLASGNIYIYIYIAIHQELTQHYKSAKLQHQKPCGNRAVSDVMGYIKMRS